MFSSASSTGSRLKDWNTKPSLSRRSRVSPRSSRAVMSTPSTSTVPEVGRSSPARMCRRVDLPDSGGPHHGGEPAGRELYVHAGQGGHGRLAGTVLLAERSGSNPGHGTAVGRRGVVDIDVGLVRGDKAQRGGVHGLIVAVHLLMAKLGTSRDRP